MKTTAKILKMSLGSGIAFGRNRFGIVRSITVGRSRRGRRGRVAILTRFGHRDILL